MTDPPVSKALKSFRFQFVYRTETPGVLKKNNAMRNPVDSPIASCLPPNERKG